MLASRHATFLARSLVASAPRRFAPCRALHKTATMAAATPKIRLIYFDIKVRKAGVRRTQGDKDTGATGTRKHAVCATHARDGSVVSLRPHLLPSSRRLPRDSSPSWTSHLTRTPPVLPAPAPCPRCDTQARAEPIRLAFTIAGVPFEDVRVKHSGPDAEWPKLKATLPLGQVPVLEVDGKQLAQSYACLGYAGRLANLHGADSWSAAKVDEILYTLQEIDTLRACTSRDMHVGAASKH